MKVNYNMKNDAIKIYVLIIIGIVILTVVGTTFAFFSLGVENEGASGVTYELSDQATLRFEKGIDLVIDANLENFSQSDGTLSSSTTATVTLEGTENYTSEYYVYFQINSNDFVYTTEEETPELVLVIKKSDGSYVTEIEGLTTTTVGNLTGFDVTTKDDYLVEIATPEWLTLNYSSTNTSVSADWTFTLYFINLDTNQNENSGKIFDSEIVMSGKTYKMSKLLSERLLIDHTGESKMNLAIDNILEKEEPIFSEVADTEEGMYATEDNYGTSYYYRGVQEKNYVSFANMLWRVIRIDGEGNVKMILFNESLKENSYQGLDSGQTYSYANSNTGSTYLSYSTGTASSPTVRYYIDTWYENNLLNTEYENYLSKDALYCNDRDIYSTTSSSSSTLYTYYYNGYSRLYTNKTPSLKCTNTSYSYSVNDTATTNGSLTYPIALITADELAFAGAKMSTENSEFYLNFGVTSTTMTPYTYYYKRTGYVYATLTFYLKNDGSLGSLSVTTATSIFPVITLNSEILNNSGDGTIENPYNVVQ